MNVNKRKYAESADGKTELYLRQKKLLDTFLEHHAITKQQYDKSLGDLTEKMGMSEILREVENQKEN